MIVPFATWISEIDIIAAELGCIDEAADDVSGIRGVGSGPRTATGVLDAGKGIGVFVEKGVEVSGTSAMFRSAFGRTSTGFALMDASICAGGGVINSTFGL